MVIGRVKFAQQQSKAIWRSLNTGFAQIDYSGTFDAARSQKIFCTPKTLILLFTNGVNKIYGTLKFLFQKAEFQSKP